MNKERILRLADRISKGSRMKLPRYRQDTWLDDYSGYHLNKVKDIKELDKEGWCKTTACIAGHTLIMKLQEVGLRGPKDISGEYVNIADVAQRYLSLTDLQADKLFMGVPSNASAKQAAKVLRNLVETGDVNWKV